MITVLCLLLVIIGAINWFSVGVFDFNIIDWIFSGNLYLGARIIYGIVGVAALWLLIYLIYNRFSPRRIGAMETRARKKAMHDMQAKQDEYAERKEN